MGKVAVIAFVIGIVVAVGFYELTGYRITSGQAPQIAQAAPAASPAAPQSAAPGPAAIASRPPPRIEPQAVKAQDNDDLRNRASFAEAQLEAIEGRAVQWPHDVRAEFRREAIEKQIEEFVISRGLGKLKSMDCSEYPCVQVIELASLGSKSAQDLHASLREMIKKHYTGPVALSLSRSQNGTTNLVGMSVVPNDEETKERVRHRTSVELKDQDR